MRILVPAGQRFRGAPCQPICGMATMSTTQILGLFGGVVGGIILRLIMAVIKARTTTFKTPKGLRRKVDRHEVKADEARDCTRETFREKKLPKDIDYVVIGSGMGGLYCAALLARTGRRVVVLEQHYVAGGCTHTFEDKGYEFDTGLHYVGRIEKYKNLLDLVSGGGRSVEWCACVYVSNSVVVHLLCNTDHQHAHIQGEDGRGGVGSCLR
jgi:hypothetical protein